MATTTVSVSQLVKTFGQLRAVDGVSFEVNSGEIFGLLGPNGAGKTTTIRLILDIFKPDSGQVIVLGGPMSETKKDLIGYMPEERGLYRDIPLERCLVYLASLKGISPSEARARIGPLLEAFDLDEHRKKKVSELSKGMQQKAQIIVTLIHRPKLVIVDEPFAGLDPVNTRLVKDVLQGLRDEGVSLIMSTHQMHQVEALCDRLVLINQGRVVLYGDLREIRQAFSGQEIIVQSPGDIPLIPGIHRIEKHNGRQQIFLEAGASPQQLLQDLVGKGIVLDHFEVAVPTLDEIFIEVVDGRRSETRGADDR